MISSHLDGFQCLWDCFFWSECISFFFLGDIFYRRKDLRLDHWYHDTDVSCDHFVIESFHSLQNRLSDERYNWHDIANISLSESLSFSELSFYYFELLLELFSFLFNLDFLLFEFSNCFLPFSDLFLKLLLAGYGVF